MVTTDTTMWSFKREGSTPTWSAKQSTCLGPTGKRSHCMANDSIIILQGRCVSGPKLIMGNLGGAISSCYPSGLYAILGQPNTKHGQCVMNRRLSSQRSERVFLLLKLNYYNPSWHWMNLNQ